MGLLSITMLYPRDSVGFPPAKICHGPDGANGPRAASSRCASCGVRLTLVANDISAPGTAASHQRPVRRMLRGEELGESVPEPSFSPREPHAQHWGLVRSGLQPSSHSASSGSRTAEWRVLHCSRGPAHQRRIWESRTGIWYEPHVY